MASVASQAAFCANMPVPWAGLVNPFEVLERTRSHMQYTMEPPCSDAQQRSRFRSAAERMRSEPPVESRARMQMSPDDSRCRATSLERSVTHDTVTKRRSLLPHEGSQWEAPAMPDLHPPTLVSDLSGDGNRSGSRAERPCEPVISNRCYRERGSPSWAQRSSLKANSCAGAVHLSSTMASDLPESASSGVVDLRALSRASRASRATNVGDSDDCSSSQKSEVYVDCASDAESYSQETPLRLNAFNSRQSVRRDVDVRVPSLSANFVHETTLRSNDAMSEERGSANVSRSSFMSDRSPQIDRHYTLGAVDPLDDHLMQDVLPIVTSDNADSDCNRQYGSTIQNVGTSDGTECAHVSSAFRNSSASDFEHVRRSKRKSSQYVNGETCTGAGAWLDSAEVQDAIDNEEADDCEIIYRRSRSQSPSDCRDTRQQEMGRVVEGEVAVQAAEKMPAGHRKPSLRTCAESDSAKRGSAPAGMSRRTLGSETHEADAQENMGMTRRNTYANSSHAEVVYCDGAPSSSARASARSGDSAAQQCVVAQTTVHQPLMHQKLDDRFLEVPKPDTHTPRRKSRAMQEEQQALQSARQLDSEPAMRRRRDTATSYEVLGVGPRDAADDVKRRYREAVLLHHPDRGGNHEQFLEVQGAIEHISAKRSSVACAVGRRKKRASNSHQSQQGATLYVEDRWDGVEQEQPLRNNPEAYESALDVHGYDFVDQQESVVDANMQREIAIQMNSRNCSERIQVIDESAALHQSKSVSSRDHDCVSGHVQSVPGSRRHTVGSSQRNQKSSQTSRRHTFEGHAHSVDLPEADEDVEQHSLSQEDICAQTEDRMSIQARHVSPSASGSRRHTVGSSQRNSRLDQKNSQTSRRHTVESHAHGDVALRDSTSMRDALTGQPAQSAVPLKDDVVAQHRLSQEGMYAQPEGCMSIQTREVLADEAKSRTRRETVASVELDARRTNKDADSNRRQRNTLGTVEESKELRQRLRSPRDLESGGCQQKRGSQIGEVPHDCQRIAHPSAQPATEVEKPFPTLLKQGEPCAAKAQPGIKQKSLQASPESSCAVNRRNMSLEEMPPAGCTMRAAAALPSLREPAFESREPVRLAPDLRGASQRGSCPISRFSA
eukprot:TRINITY_DN10595_c0_g1_i5.p1 TRINITY_DN10595_c0_g1~~TRINITY_DN10595_c0_g1_i5.p1  ORF type:complete len:1237 (+),score=134.51 TRINITY_DN10595_c0_g1_i5:357-3713(+)